MANAAPVHHTPGDIERARHEMFPHDVARGLTPGNPFIKGNEYGKAGAEFPKMLFRAAQVPPGLPGAGKYQVSVSQPGRYGFRDDDEWNAARQEAQRFTESCNHVVHDEDQLLKARGQGWRETQQEAIALAEASRIERGDIAGARNYEDRNMSERAKAERDKKEAAHFGHLPAIPETPIVRRVKKAAKGKGAKAAA